MIVKEQPKQKTILEKLTRYVPEIKVIDGYPYVRMIRSKRKHKSYVKYEDLPKSI